MMTSSATQTGTFTLTHAKYLASKVATDLRRISRMYGDVLSLERIANYEQELTELLKVRGVEKVTYGFRRNGLWTLAAVQYVASADGSIVVDDDPGKLRANVDIMGATFGSFLIYSDAWGKLESTERVRIKQGIVIKRDDSDEPSLESGGWSSDLNYSSAGVGLSRSTPR